MSSDNEYKIKMAHSVSHLFEYRFLFEDNKWEVLSNLFSYHTCGCDQCSKDRITLINAIAGRWVYMHRHMTFIVFLDDALRIHIQLNELQPYELRFYF